MQSRKNKSLTTNHKSPRPKGSALILAVVLVSLLAVVGVMFAMVARIDKMSTSAIAENKTLNLAVDTVIAKISQELASDVPVKPSQEYYDYPDADNAWLASLEPKVDDRGTPTPLDDIYYWRQISDIYYRFGPQDFWNLRSVIIDDYQEPAEIGDSNGYTGDPNDLYFADADGDGVSDSMWVKLDNITSSKGRPIYAAVRIIDNGAMLNVNTSYKFDPCDPEIVHIDGSSQMQINLMALSWRPWGVYDANDETKLLNARANYGFGGIDPLDLDEYKKNVVWRYNDPCGPYTPFDISDELEVRNRFLLNHTDIDARLESWGGEFRNKTISTPVEFGGIELNNWFKRANGNSLLDPCDPNYAYRHIATTYNMDRIINPVGPTLNSGKMVNINNPADANELYYTLLASIDPNIAGVVLAGIQGQFAQLAVNVVDFIDDNNEVTVFGSYYGFDAQPFITEIGFIISDQPQFGGNYYAVELYNPFNDDILLEDFELVLMDIGSIDPNIRIQFGPGEVILAGDYLVIANDPGQFVIDTNNVKPGPQLDFFGTWEPTSHRQPPRGTGGRRQPPAATSVNWANDYELFLMRKVDPNDPNMNIYVDRQWINPADANRNDEKYFGRDVRDWRIVYQSLREDTIDPNGTLGSININTNVSTELPFSFFLPNPLDANHPNKKFITVGDIPRVLTIGHSDGLNNTIGEKLTLAVNEGEIRLDLQSPYYSNIFKYLTVFDPTTDGIDNNGDGSGIGTVDPNELKIPGRININTAPWYVIAQLPWVSAHTPNYELARAIVAYRDKLDLSSSIPPGPDYYRLGAPNSRASETGVPNVRENFGFASIGELNFVIAGGNNYSIQRSEPDGDDLAGFPDLTTEGPGLGDGVEDDFEERDVIFSRISNLVTVRSDVFTAYILIRIGNDGPQKRSVAILDRSDFYPGGTGRVKVRALHPVADPR